VAEEQLVDVRRAFADLDPQDDVARRADEQRDERSVWWRRQGAEMAMHGTRLRDRSDESDLAGATVEEPAVLARRGQL
jgi:hypothetical protein